VIPGGGDVKANVCDFRKWNNLPEVGVYDTPKQCRFETSTTTHQGMLYMVILHVWHAGDV